MHPLRWERREKRIWAGVPRNHFVKFRVSAAVSVCVAAAASLAAGQERQGRKRSKVAGGGDWRIVAIERGERRPPCMAVSVDIFFLPSSRGSIHSFSTRFSFMRAFGYDLLGMHANKSSRSFTLLTPSPWHTRQTGHSNTLFSSSNVDLLGMESCLGNTNHLCTRNLNVDLSLLGTSYYLNFGDQRQETIVVPNRTIDSIFFPSFSTVQI